MAGIDDLDADRTCIHIARAGPEGNTGMPGPAFFRDMREHRSILIDRVMRADPGFRIAEPRHRRCTGLHAGVVQYQDVDRRIRRAVVEIRRWRSDQLHYTPSAGSN